MDSALNIKHDLAPFFFHEVIQVQETMTSIQLDFHPFGSISISPPWTLLTADGMVVGSVRDDARRDQSVLHRLLSQKLTSISGSMRQALHLAFSSGHTLSVQLSRYGHPGVSIGAQATPPCAEVPQDNPLALTPGSRDTPIPKDLDLSCLSGRRVLAIGYRLHGVLVPLHPRGGFSIYGKWTLEETGKVLDSADQFNCREPSRLVMMVGRRIEKCVVVGAECIDVVLDGGLVMKLFADGGPYESIFVEVGGGSAGIVLR